MTILGKYAIHEALAELGREARLVGPTELLIIGGAAGVMTGALPEAWTTSDVDAVEFHPPAEVEEILRAAATVGRRLSLPANWLNTEAGLYAHDLPADWERRRHDAGEFGKLHIWALGRLDLIAMKFFAHRPIDRAHLSMMHVTATELNFVRTYLKHKMEDDSGKAAMGLEYVNAWEVAR